MKFRLSRGVAGRQGEVLQEKSQTRVEASARSQQIKIPVSSQLRKINMQPMEELRKKLEKTETHHRRLSHILSRDAPEENKEFDLCPDL